MTAAQPRLKPGDVLQLIVDGGLAQVQYVGRHPQYGDAIWVSRKVHDRPPGVKPENLAGGYLTFYPASAAFAQGLVEWVGRLPARRLPQRMRRPGGRSGRLIKNWIIEDGNNEVVKTELSKDELQLPIAVIWNHALLQRRIAEGWDPTQEGDADNPGEAEEDTMTAPHASPKSDARSIVHYLYLSDRSKAAALTPELKHRGFDIDQRLSADGRSWLVLARHEAVPSDAFMNSTRRDLEQLAATAGGEYDGWEIEV